MAEQININSIINEIMRIENATADDIDQDALEAFKINCEYIDIICGHHELGERIDVDFSINDEKNIVVRMRFDGRPPLELRSYQLLKIGALEDRIVKNNENQYLIVVVLGSFIK